MKIKNLLLFILLTFVPFIASAEVFQFSVCTYKDGKSIGDVQAWLEDWRGLVKREGKQYELKLLTANAGSHKLKPGSQFALLGNTPTLTTYGDGWDFWYGAKAAEQSRTTLQSLASCSANSIWVSTD